MAIRIDPSVADPADVEILEDLVNVNLWTSSRKQRNQRQPPDGLHDTLKEFHGRNEWEKIKPGPK